MPAAERAEEDGECWGGCVGGCAGSAGLQEGGLVTVSLWRGGCCACIHSLWETAVGITYGCDGEEQDRCPEGPFWCGVLHPKALCGLFQAPLVRPEGDLFSDTNISRTQPKKQQWGRAGVNWELPPTSQPRAVPQAQDPGCSSCLDAPAFSWGGFRG